MPIAGTPIRSTAAYLRNLLVDHLFRSATMAKPSGLYFALFKADGTEVSGNGYTRANLPPSDANWTATQGGTTGASSGSGAITTNAQPILFPDPTGDWGTVVELAMFDDPIAGGVLYRVPLAVARAFSVDTGAPSFGVGAITMDFGSGIMVLEDAVTVLTTTSTGAQNDFNPGALSNLNVVRANNASLLTITGLANGIDGQMVWIESIGAGQVDIKNQDTGSAAANRVINNVTATISLAAGSGRALLCYDATTQRWRVLEHEQGAWINVPYNAGDYSASGSMTITPNGAPSKHAYWLKGRTLVYELDVYSTWTIGGTLSGTVYVAIPGGFAAQGQSAAPAIIYDNGTMVAGSVNIGVGPDVTKFHFDKLSLATWSASTARSGAITSFSFEVQ